MRIIVRVRSTLFVVVLLCFSVLSFGQIGISVSFGPPALPVYTQPPCPAEGYIWNPGYWAWDPDAGQYYWVPGTWVPAPEPGYLWTPPWWGWSGGVFLFHAGYWGPHIGFYGGINYGYGYFGNGYEGGRWQGGHFFYNRTVNNVNVTNIHNTYNTTIINNNTTVNRVSYNGGNGGINARPTPQEEAAERERHISPIAAQTQHVQEARANPQLRAQVNHGKPPIAATPKPAEFKGRDVVQAKEAGAPYKPPAERAQPGSNENKGAAGNENRAVPRPNEKPGATGNENRAEPRANENRPGAENNNVPRPPNHASELPKHEAPPPSNTGNAKQDQKYQQQQQKLNTRLNQQHQKLAQQQAKEDQRLQQQHASEAQRQQTEQRHAQQTQQMEAKHQQQLQRLQQKQAPPKEREGPPKH